MWLHLVLCMCMHEHYSHNIPLIGLCIPVVSRGLPVPTTFMVGVLLLLPGDGEFGDDGLIATKLGICDTFTTVGAFGSVGAVAKRGVGGELLPALLSIGRSMMCTLPGCVTLGA